MEAAKRSASTNSLLVTPFNPPPSAASKPRTILFPPQTPLVWNITLFLRPFSQSMDRVVGCRARPARGWHPLRTSATPERGRGDENWRNSRGPSEPCLSRFLAVYWLGFSLGSPYSEFSSVCLGPRTSPPPAYPSPPLRRPSQPCEGGWRPAPCNLRTTGGWFTLGTHTYISKAVIAEPT